jgi:hypothetical protein
VGGVGAGSAGGGGEFPVTAALLALGTVGLLAVAVWTGLYPVLDRALGPYRGITQRDTVPTDVSLALTVEIVAMAIGTGILPAVAAAAWAARAVRRPATRGWWFAITALLMVASVWATALFAQSGFLGAATEERYYFYAAPLLWIGALAALEDPDVGPAAIVAWSGPVIVGLAAVPILVGLNPETEFLAPVLAAAVSNIPPRLVSGVAGFGVHDLLVAVAVALVAIGAATWTRPRRAAVALGIALAVQIALTGYLFAAVRGDVPAIPPRTTDDQHELAWVARAGDGDVTLIRGARVAGRELELNFWNGEVRHFGNPAGGPAGFIPYPLFLLESAEVQVSPRGDVALPGLRARAVQDPASPFLQLAGRRVAASSDGALELITPERPARARWATFALDGDGFVSRPAQLIAGAPSPGRPMTVIVVLESVPNAATAVTVRLGGRPRDVAFAAAPEPVTRQVRITACGPLRGELLPRTSVPLPDGRQVAGRVVGVQVRALEASSRACHR